MIRFKSDAVDRLSFFESLSQQVSKSPSRGVFFSGNEAIVLDDIACGKVIVRDGKSNSNLFYDFKTGETLRLDSAALPCFNHHCKFLFFVIKRHVLGHIQSFEIPKRKMGRCTIKIEIEDGKINFTIITKKGEILGKFAQKLLVANYKTRNISVKEHLSIKCNLLYFYQILFHSFKEYDILGIRLDESDNYFYIFGHNPKKPNIAWRLCSYK